jgi:hypothetical protein
MCAGAAVVLLGWAGYSALRPAPSPEPSFVVAPAEHDLGTIPLGEHVIHFAITNPADRPRRILGLNEK